MSSPASIRSLDLRGTPLQQAYETIYRTFNALPVGQHLEVTTDQDPTPLRTGYQLDFPKDPQWSWLESGPSVWRISLTRTSPDALSAKGACCGSCTCA